MTILIPRKAGDYRVRFVDYDGNVLKSQFVDSGYSGYPPNLPVHDNLTFDGWNNSYTNITKDMDIGAMYHTTDGYSYFYVTVTSITGLSISALQFNKSNTSTMTVYWGDGASSTSSASGNVTFSHTYSTAGNYEIRVRVANGGTYSINHTSVWSNMFNAYGATPILTGVRLSNQVTAINQFAFMHCGMLSSVSMPSTVTSIDQGAFQRSTSLTCAVFPSSVTAITDYVCQYCESIAIICLPMGATSVGAGSFGYCYSLLRITLPPAITSLGSGLFQYCYALQKLIIPSTVASVGSLAFQYCTSLRTLIVPSSVTSIAAQAFEYATTMLTYTIQRTTPPTLSNSNAFTGINGITKIRVPSASLTAYRAATNWSTYANYMEGY